MKTNLKDAGFEVYEYDPEKPYVYEAPEINVDYKFDSEAGLLLLESKIKTFYFKVKESMEKVDQIIKEATKSFDKDEL